MKKVVVVGGGFAGAKVAKNLENDFSVTLIDTKDYYEFTPGILRSIVRPNHLKHIEICHKDYLKSAKFIKDSVIGIKGKSVVLKRGKSIKFDYLVIASGSEYKAPIKAKNLLIADRGKRIIEYHKRFEKAKRIIIVGGGLVGVELAGEISCFHKEKSVTMVHSKDSLMERNYEKSRKFAKKILEKREVQIFFNERVMEYNERGVKTDKGRSLGCDLVILCTGIKPNSDFIEKELLEGKGFIKVNEFLQMDSREDVFVCGDVASIKEEKTAQGSEKQGGFVVKNLFYFDRKEKMKSYVPRRRPMVISLGKWNGIFEWKGFVLTGLIPAFMKWAIEKKTMIKYGKI